MGKKEFIPEQHIKTRSLFRVLGPLFVIVGAACMLVAFIDFFTLQGFEEPKYFWLFFVGMPFLFIGFSLSSLGYGATVAKYQSREYAPVAKDTFNYLAKETTTGVKEIANAVQQESPSKLAITCHSCHHENVMNAKFCNGCGDKLAQVCRSCQQENIPSARFCNHCGTTL
ncbi:double zinc ribbon domain-containing protein [Anaerobacillus isosaccharinicus]|uniref:Zinc ribbon domain-containing protein n=1 Tax=Anaerobacillus isosaccharinicus TaxID=1532552 RepID=A0A1S2LQ10_9BACI|nr:zinc ribbon domain-containing protein [Anaerobacillus isosaccharinicus]MBA5586229.1 zinc ribbon domain-containing protein [Anaerobacillus isosaccharinicus]QOY35515.1 zinc ribbon domain-containing protein [Anaerobacillus isosaccharinicus]